MRILLCYLVVLFSLHTPFTADAQLQKIYLYPKGAGNAKQSQFVDSIRFIPLEIKDGAEAGLYNNVTIADNYFLVIDHSNSQVFIYSRSGKFVRKINYKKLGLGFYPNYNEHANQLVFVGNNKNYELTPKDELKIKLDWNNPRNKKYFKKYTIDLKDTTFTFTKAVPDESDINDAYNFHDDYYWQGRISTSPFFKDSLDYEFKIYKDNKLVKAYFPYNRINEPRFLYMDESSTFTKTDPPNTYFIVRPYCDTIYKLNKDSLFPAFQLVLPLENSLPSSFYTKPFKNKTEKENFMRNNGWVFHQIYYFHETPQFVFFLVQYLSNIDSYIYLKQGAVTYKTKNIKADTSQYNLQLLTDYNLLKKGNRFYKSQKAGDIINFFKQHKEVPVPSELKEFLKTNPPATTPVIVEFKLKN